MKILQRKDIDTDRWDQRISENETENIFCYSWYLDAVADEWCAVTTDNYKTIVPVPFTIKLGIRQMYNAPFCREYDIFGSEFNWTDVATILHKEFKGIHFRNASADLFDGGTERKHQWLTLGEDVQSNYRTNARRLVKKGNGIFNFGIDTEVTQLVELFRRTAARKIDSINDEDLERLIMLMDNAMAHNQGELILAEEEGKMVAGGFFLKDKSSITYLKGAAEDDAKKNGVMFSLLDFAFQRYSQDFETFDFGGSDVEAVATFYKKFGAKDRVYYDYKIERLPLWFKTLKKLRS